jgi:CBS domain-containing protein
MITVRQLMKAKDDQTTYAVSPLDTVYRAIELMAEQNVGAVLVREKDNILGIFTERDYLRKVILQNRASKETPIQDIMTTEMITVTPETDLETCMGFMRDYRIRHLPVLENGRLVGMVSMRDVIDTLMAYKEKRIEFLEDYIMGREYRK